MARIRTIKPDFFANEKLSTLPTDAVLLAAALLCYADDEGYFLAHPGLVRAGCLPLREDSRSPTVMLQELSSIGFLELQATTEGKALGRIPKFRTHQTINKPTPSKLRALWKLPEDYGSTTGGVRVGSGSGNGSGKGKGKNTHPGENISGEKAHAPAPPREAQPGVTEQPVAAPAPEGVRVMPSPRSLTPEQRNLVDLVVLASPPGIVAGLTAGAITPAHRVPVIQAAKREAEEHGISTGEALEGLRIAVESQASAIAPDRLNLLGGLEKYFNQAKYRVNPVHVQERSNGKPRGEQLIDNAKIAYSRLEARFEERYGSSDEHEPTAQGKRIAGRA